MDEFHFVFKTLQGNGSVTARVERIEGGHRRTEASVTIRAGLEPGAEFAAVFATSGSGLGCYTCPIANRDATADDRRHKLLRPLCRIPGHSFSTSVFTATGRS